MQRTSFKHGGMNEQEEQKILPTLESSKFLKYVGLFFFILFCLTLQYCIGFAIYQNESATGIHVFPHPEPSSLLPPHTIPLGPPSAPAPSIQSCVGIPYFLKVRKI